MTPWVQRLLLTNVVVFLFSRAFPALIQDFALVPLAILWRPWTLVTYMFLHGGFMHILFNMLMLFFFGPRLEERLGSRTFIWFYLTCGVGGAVLSFATPFSMIVGASGAIFGVVVGFARYWPREEIYIWGVLPVQARILAIFMVVSSLWAGFAGAQDGIAHFAHLGGLVAGWIYLRAWERRRQRRVANRPARPRRVSIVVDLEALERWRTIPREHLHEINREEVDKLLRKANESGARALTADERAFLDRMSGAG
ncbi:MAG: rhomboid family intramembrane serine protease [Gemmatimonadota bacterium]|nr:rhomboid family intramembrane serine protease [Gemmatimonadota bacterium]MDE2871865.1 rhomboid family intramembrane serine protease [Gemmatimonadota bacterium]